MNKNIQVCATIPESLSNDIIRIADKDKRTFSQTVSLLLHQSVKERNRKKIAKQKNSTEHNTTDLG